MNRSSMGRPTRPMPKMSAKKLAALGGFASSTFDKPQTPAGGGNVPASVRGLKASAMKQKRLQPAVSVEVRVALRKRAGEGWWCEAQLEGCQGRGIDPHHRITRGVGGRHGEAKERSDRMSALLLLCRSCHRWAHEHPAAAEPLGLLLPQSAITAQVPVLYRGEPMYLSDDGKTYAFEDAGA